MIIDIYGDALRLLDHFIYYATGKDFHRLADAMWYDIDGFQLRAALLEQLVIEARTAEPVPLSSCKQCGHLF
jgi:hypothetical protein